MYAYIRIYTHIYAYVRVYTHIYVHTRIYTHIYAHALSVPVLTRSNTRAPALSGLLIVRISMALAAPRDSQRLSEAPRGSQRLPEALPEAPGGSRRLPETLPEAPGAHNRLNIRYMRYIGDIR